MATLTRNVLALQGGEGYVRYLGHDSEFVSMPRCAIRFDDLASAEAVQRFHFPILRRWGMTCSVEELVLTGPTAVHYTVPIEGIPVDDQIRAWAERHAPSLAPYELQLVRELFWSAGETLLPARTTRSGETEWFGVPPGRVAHGVTVDVREVE